MKYLTIVLSICRNSNAGDIESLNKVKTKMETEISTLWVFPESEGLPSSFQTIKAVLKVQVAPYENTVCHSWRFF